MGYEDTYIFPILTRMELSLMTSIASIGTIDVHDISTYLHFNDHNYLLWYMQCHWSPGLLFSHHIQHARSGLRSFRSRISMRYVSQCDNMFKQTLPSNCIILRAIKTNRMGLLLGIWATDRIHFCQTISIF